MLRDIMSKADGESLKDVFYIVKGQYRDKAPKIVCESGREVYVGGYDPSSEETNEWYRVLDKNTFYTVYCGSSLEGALNAITKEIKKFGSQRQFYKHVCKVTNEDYYEVHYLHHAPISEEERENRRVEGRCPRVSPVQKELERAVYETYGDYYQDLIDEYVEKGVEALEKKDPLKKSSGLRSKFKLKKKTTTGEVVEKPKEVRNESSLKKVKVRRIKMLG